MTGVLEVLRGLNVALSIIAVTLLYVRLVDTWARLSRGLRMARWGLVLLAGAAAFGSAIKYINHTPTDWSIVLVTVSCLLIDVGMLISRRDPNNHI